MKLLFFLFSYLLFSSCTLKKTSDSSINTVIKDSSNNRVKYSEIIINNKMEEPKIKPIQRNVTSVKIENKSIILSLKNLFNKPLFYTSEVTFEKWNVNKWEKLNFIDTYIFVSMEYILQPNDTRSHTFYFSSFAVSPIKGKHRVIKSYYFDDKIKKEEIKEFKID